MKAIVTKAKTQCDKSIPDVLFEFMLFKRFFFFKNAELGVQNQIFISRNYGRKAVEIRIEKYFPSFHCG